MMYPVNQSHRLDYQETPTIEESEHELNSDFSGDENFQPVAIDRSRSDSLNSIETQLAYHTDSNRLSDITASTRSLSSNFSIKLNRKRVFMAGLLCAVGQSFLNIRVSVKPEFAPNLIIDKFKTDLSVPQKIFLYETDDHRMAEFKKNNLISDSSEIHPDLRMIKTAKQLPSVDVRQLGRGRIFEGFSDKWLEVRTVLENADQISDDEIILIADNRDTMLNIQQGKTGWNQVRKFRETFNKLTFDHPGAVVMSAEPRCCVSALTHVTPGQLLKANGERDLRACSSGQDDCLWRGVQFIHDGLDNTEAVNNQLDYDALGNQWKFAQESLANEHMANDHMHTPEEKRFSSKYLNAGVVAGRKKDLLNLIELADLQPREDDQAVFTDIRFRFGNSEIVLDYFGEIFGNNDWADMNGCKFRDLDKDTGSLFNRETKEQPFLLHWPGFNTQTSSIQCMIGGAKQLGHPVAAQLLSKPYQKYFQS